MVLGKRWLFSIGNGAEIPPLEMGRKSPDSDFPIQINGVARMLKKLRTSKGDY